MQEPVGSVRFEFRLTPLDRYVPWDPARAVSWFELTDGEQVVWLDDQALFSSELLAPERAGERRWLDYSVVRMWEDVLELFPYLREPVPAEIARRLEPGAGWERWRERAWAWLERADDEAADELEQALGWASRRTLDVGHLVAAPRLSFVRVGDVIRTTCEPRGDTTSMGLRWVCTPACVEQRSAEVTDELERFARALLGRMEARIAAIARGALAGRAVVDLVALRDQHAQRERQLARALAASPDEIEDWDRIARALETLDAAIQGA